MTETRTKAFTCIYPSGASDISLGRTLLTVFNQYQSEAISADIKEKLAHKARKGGTIGYAPVGYLNVKEEYDGRKVSTVAVDSETKPLHHAHV